MTADAHAGPAADGGRPTTADHPRTRAGRRSRRHWTGHGRAHIEVRGVHEHGREAMARHLERELARLDGVDWAAVNQVTARVVVAFDGEQVGVADLLQVIEAVEAHHGLSEEPFPHDRPEYPGDVEPLRRQLWAVAADSAGFGLGLLTRALRANLLSAEMAALVGLVEATPAFRRPLEDRLGPVADIGLAGAHAAAQSLAGSPLSLAVDGMYRALAAAELACRRQVWEEREPELHGGGGAGCPPLDLPPRAVPVPEGPLERYARRSAGAGVAGALGALAVARDPRLAVAATVAGNPKPARLGREAFATALGVLLAARGVLTVDPAVLRRLDRVDAVVLDADVLLTGRRTLGAVWVPRERADQEDQLWLACRMLFDPAAPDARQASDGWWLGPVSTSDLPRGGDGWRAGRTLRRLPARVLGLHDPHGLAALVEVVPEVDPLARALVVAARDVGQVHVAGLQAGARARLGVDKLVRGGSRLHGEVRRLQEAGHVVAVVSARQHAALAAADVGIGVHRDRARTPWGAHLVTSRGLLDAWLVLQSALVARTVTRRSIGYAAYGSGAASVLALAGRRGGATGRAGAAVNSAAGVSALAGVWAARGLARRPEPLDDEVPDWHAMSVEDVLMLLRSGPDGLSRDEADRRSTAARGQTSEPGRPDVLRATVDELANPLTPALATGAGLSAALGSIVDAALIGSVMGFNALIGGIQRVGADHAVRRLMETSTARVHVRRGGVELLATSETLAVGDVVVLRAGDAVPADCRIVVARGVEVDESSLTGESQLVGKSAEPSAARSVAERRSMLYAGTAVAAGEATAVVTATGDVTEAGRSARIVVGHPRRSGVEARLRRLTAQTIPLSLGAGAALLGGGLLHGRSLTQTLNTGVGLAVAAVPEGLPLVATIAQLAAARRLSGRNALVRHATTIEALGRVDVLCADKTGTLTTGRIDLRLVSDGTSEVGVEDLDAAGRDILAAALRATPGSPETGSVPHPTDRAVIHGARDAGVSETVGAAGWKAAAELPFEPSRGYHAVLGRTRSGWRLAVKGAPEAVLPRCRTWRRGHGASRRLDARGRLRLQRRIDQLARRGYRVLALAERAATGRADLDDERLASLELVGLVAMADPVRASAAQAVSGLRAAGVEVVMVTGDHPSTAEAIAAELGLLDGDGVLTGPELDTLSDDELVERAQGCAVFARVTPVQKVRIVQALQAAGRVVAMTGDGANDAAAIRLADVGVALGSHATNAAKDAADVVVTDDRIETIIDAIVEGRAMWASVRDAVAVLVGGNLGEIAFTLGSELLLPGGSPLNARQLLLVNLFTDLVPALALAARPPVGADPKALAREGPDASLGAVLTRDILTRGLVTAAAGGFGWQAGRLTGISRSRAGTVALVSLVGSQLGQTLAAGWRNPLVAGSALASAGALAAVVQTPGVSHFFGCRPLGPVGWTIGLSAAAGSALAAPALGRLAEQVPKRGTD